MHLSQKNLIFTTLVKILNTYTLKNRAHHLYMYEEYFNLKNVTLKYNAVKITLFMK